MYDPSDLTSMFQDSAGTTAAVVGQPVGLVLDKSQGLVLGSDVGFTFDSATGWTLGSGIAITGGNLVFTNVAQFAVAEKALVLTSGVFYKFVIDVTSISAGATLQVADGATAIKNITAAGVYTVYFKGAGRPSIFVQALTAALSASVASISIKPLAGYHATQSTSTARPILARHPISGRRNLLTYTEDFSNAVWAPFVYAGGSCSKTPNYSIAPDGTTTACRVVATAPTTASDGGVLRYSTLMTAVLTRSIWIKSNTGANQTITIIPGVSGATITVTPEWARYTFTSANQIQYLMDVGVYRTGSAYDTDASCDVSVWHPQNESGSSVTAYQKVTSTYDVTEAGVNDAYYLKFDGVDDFLVTPSIDFSGTDKMSVFVGGRKLSDAAASMLVELGTNTSTVNGSFCIDAPDNATGANYGFYCRGTAAAGYGATTYTAPITNTLSAIFNIAGAAIDTEIIPKVNGSAPTLTVVAAGPAGTGNFASLPIYIGMRAGTSLPFNGHLYGLVVAGALYAASQNTAAETFMNSKTGAY